MPKVKLVNTGTGAFVVTAADGSYVTVPPLPPKEPPPPPPPPAAEAKEPEGPPVNEVEVELDEAMLKALQQRQEKGSPLRIGGGGHGKAHEEKPHEEPKLAPRH